MKTLINAFETIKRMIADVSKQLRFDTLLPKIGRKLALKIETVIALALSSKSRTLAPKNRFTRSLNRTARTKPWW